MATTFQMPQFYGAPLTVDTKQAPKYFDDDDSILDDNILDQSGMDSGLEMSPPNADGRRDSFAVSTTLFSPKDDWTHSMEMPLVPSNMSNNPFLNQHHSNNPFLRLDQQHQTTYGQQGGHWGSVSSTTSGTSTPVGTIDGLPRDFDSASSIFQPPATMPLGTSFGNMSSQGNNMFQQPMGGHPSDAMSPQKDNSWTSHLKDQAKRNRPSSPMIRSHNELRRGDGIRKKNARFEIPAERNLSNIDHLISQSTDEQEIKELKQQKRLLRNRQAALDSRQRKKQHTERLEDEKKQFTELINGMENEMDDLRAQMEQMMREKEQYTQYIETLTLEKEEMIRAHTIETGELRKKVNVLTNHVQTLENAAMATQQSMPPQPTFPHSFGEMEGLAMDGVGWDNMHLFNDFTMEQQPHPEVKQEMQLVSTKKPEITLPNEVEKASSQPGGILFMLFLVGAFVLSNRATAPIKVSEDMAEASAAILQNVFKDAGVQQSSSGMGAMAPQPSGTRWTHASVPSMSVSSSAMAMDGVAPSMLGDLTDSLSQPSQQQTNEEIFSMTAAQYNHVAGTDYLNSRPPVERSTSQGRRNLAEALANMRNHNKEGAAEVYTRSLLWDQIPTDVVRNFAKMVAECNASSGQDSNDTEL